MKISAILWGIVFLFAATFFFVVSTWFLVFLYPIIQEEMALTLFLILLYIVAILIGLIFVAATGRCFYNAKTGDIGIADWIKIFGLISLAFFALFILLWLFLP